MVTILLGTALSSVVGAVSDYYFGDAINSLMGGYQDNDLLLIIDESNKSETIKEIEDILANRLSGAKLKRGISLAGKSNLFIELASESRNRTTLLKLEDYFSAVEGLLTTSLMTEPRLTIEGLNQKSRDILAEKINRLDQVDFTFPDGNSLEVILTEAQFRPTVKREIKGLLKEYELLGIRFPKQKEGAELLKLGTELKEALAREYNLSVYNVSKNNSKRVTSAVKTMTEIKEFLNSYAAEIKIKLFKQDSITVGEELVIPAGNKEKIYLRVNSLNDMIATAVITTGDSSAIVGQTVYQAEAGTVGSPIGKLEVDNPRQKLSYLVTELKKLVPTLGTIFTEADLLFNDLTKLLTTLELLKDLGTEIEALSLKIADYSQDLATVDKEALRTDLATLEDRLGKLVVIIERLEFMRDLITDLRAELAALQQRIILTQRELDPNSNYYHNLAELAERIRQGEEKIAAQTDGIIKFINQYNPLLAEIKGWQQNLQNFQLMVDKLITAQPAEFSAKLADLSKQNLAARIKEFSFLAAEDRLSTLKADKIDLTEIDFAGITSQLEYIEQSLPKLKDEEITESIDLLDRYLAGKVMPGTEISLLVAQNNQLTEIKERIRELMSEQVSFYRAPMGVVVPNLRSQIYQMLSEVKVVLTALTAIIWTCLSLAFDQGLIITSWQKIKEENSWYRASSFYYSLGVGSFILGGIVYLTGLESPYLPSWSSLLLGALLGLLAYKKAAAINDFAETDFKAGAAFGFNYAQIMRQIIIPQSKPGLLKVLNQSKTYF